MGKEEIVKQIIEDDRMCPCLLLGKYVVEFKRQYKDRIFTVNTLESVRYVVDNYSNIPDLEGRKFVLDGIGFLSQIGQNSLLKFIEESKFPIVLLSYYDKVSSIIMSRVKFVYKESPVKVTNLKFVKPAACLEYVKEKKEEKEDSGGFTEEDKISYYGDNCPILYYFEKRVKGFDGISTRATKLITELP